MALIRRIGFARFSRCGDNLGRLEVSSAKHTDALDGTDELNLTCSEDLTKGDRIVWVDLQGVCHEHIVDTAERTHDGNGSPATKATCINSINETWDDWIGDKRPSGGVSAALSSILSGTRWEVGTCDQEGTASKTFYHESVREALAGLLATWGGELETTVVHDGSGVIARRVGVRARRGSSASAKRFTWTKDLVSVKRTVASDNPKTRVYGYGKGVETDGGGYGRRLTFGDINGGKDYVEDAEATAVWGHPDGEGGILPAVTSYVSEQCEDAAQLLRETKDYLERTKEPKVAYTASVIDLYAFGRSWEGVGVGDDVAIVDKGFSDEGVRLRGRVSQIERDLLTGDATVTFGTLTDAMADMWQSVSNALKGNSQQNAIYDAAAGTSASWLQQLQSALNAQFNAAGTYKVETFELGTIWSNVPIDDETGLPVKAASNMWAVNINGAGIRLAANLDSNGQWDWRTFLTGAMVSADAINAGSMRAERVRAGLLTDEAGKNFWDLSAGEFSLASTTKVGGKTVSQIADAAVDGQTQKDVFDKLTNNGQTQGIYLSNGKLYINGDYISAGTISGNRIKGGTIEGSVYRYGDETKYTKINGSMLFTTDGSDALLIDSDGVLIGEKAQYDGVEGGQYRKTSIGSYGLHVACRESPIIPSITNTGYVDVGVHSVTGLDTSSPIFYSNRDTGESGWAVVSENSNNYKFYFQVGNSYLEIQTTFGAYGFKPFNSDKRDKERICDSAVNATDVINEIRHRRFKWKDVVDGLGEEHEGCWVDCGFVAQELEEVDPSFVFTVAKDSDRERLQISEPSIIPYITKAIQELSSRIEGLERAVFEGGES